MSIDSLQISDSDALLLSQAGYNDIADLASDNKITKSEISWISVEKRISFQKNLEKIALTQETKIQLLSLLQEIEKTIILPLRVSDTKNEKKSEITQETVGKDFETFSESHGYLYAFARAFTMGYIPQTHDSKFLSEKEAPIDFVRKMKWVAFGGFFTNGSPDSIKRWSLHKDTTSFYNNIQGAVKQEVDNLEVIKNQVQAIPGEWLRESALKECAERKKWLNILKGAIESNPPNHDLIKIALKEYQKVAKMSRMEFAKKYGIVWTLTGGGKWENLVKEIHKKETADPKNAKEKIIEASEKILELRKSALTKLDELEKNPNDPKIRAETLKVIGDTNKQITLLERAGAEGLSRLESKNIATLGTKNPWVADFLKANGGLDKTTQWFNEQAKGKVGKPLLWVGIISLLYNNKEGFLDLVKGGKVGDMATRILDFGVGMVPVASSVHEYFVLEDGWYKNFILGEKYKLSDTEKNFRRAFMVAGVVPFGWAIAKTWGRLVLAGTEGASKGLVESGGKWVGNHLILGADIAVTGTQSVMQLGTYAVLGMSAMTMTYDLYQTGEKYYWNTAQK